MRKVMVGMSGGVDSSVAALLLLEQGVQVEGVTLSLRGGKLSELTGDPGNDADALDAQRVCGALGIPHRVVDLSEVFRGSVVENFVDEYLAGRTPNPCVICNRRIKFGAMLEYALENGADAVATGHYARVAYDKAAGRWQLFRAASGKDQSYVLYGLTQHMLAHTLFPLYGMEKSEVRALAESRHLPVAHKGDSMEVCFIPGDDHAAFLERYSGQPMTPGDFVDENGSVLGRHRGIGRYTIGQRKGLGIALGRPMYVVAIDAPRNRVVLGEEGRQMRQSLTATGLNYVSIAPPDGPLMVEAKIRYQASPAPATLTPLDGDRIRLDFQRPQRSVTPGQAVVFYKGPMVLGGGTIENVNRME